MNLRLRLCCCVANGRAERRMAIALRQFGLSDSQPHPLPPKGKWPSLPCLASI